MSELQVSKFYITREDLVKQGGDCGGGYRINKCEIVVDAHQPDYLQRVALVHEILGAYLGTFVQTDTLAEMAENIIDGLDSLDQES